MGPLPSCLLIYRIPEIFGIQMSNILPAQISYRKFLIMVVQQDLGCKMSHITVELLVTPKVSHIQGGLKM